MKGDTGGKPLTMLERQTQIRFRRGRLPFGPGIMWDGLRCVSGCGGFGYVEEASRVCWDCKRFYGYLRQEARECGSSGCDANYEQFQNVLYELTNART